VSKIKDLACVVERFSASLLKAIEKQTTISTDLYASIKEVAELKYRIVELEARLSNLEAMVKMCVTKGG
jgi:SMC interacting uncharacterized protein involved in chromosome segregation